MMNLAWVVVYHYLASQVCGGGKSDIDRLWRFHHAAYRARQKMRDLGLEVYHPLWQVVLLANTHS